MNREPTVVVGRITRPHGLKGELSVLVLSEVDGRFAEGALVYLEDGRALTVESARRHRSGLLVKFREVGELKDVVVSVDTPGKRILVREVPGLTVPDAEP